MLSVCLIVKNELKNLKELIPQLLNISDDIVIVDTGSTDGTKDFLKNNSKIKFFEIKWEDDFSKARNFSIEKAKNNFILWLDADDRIKSFQKIKFNYNEIYAAKIINSSDNTYSYQLRIFPNNGEIKFHGKVHEQLKFNKEKYRVKFLNDLKIVHFGYKNREKLIEKQLRNIRILNSIKNKTFYEYIQLGQSYKILGEYEKAKNYFELALHSPQLKRENLELYSQTSYELYKIYELTAQKDAEDFLMKIIELGEFYPPIYYHAGRLFFKKGLLEKAEYYFEKFLSLHNSFKYLTPTPLKLKDSCLYFLALTKANLNKFKDAKRIVNNLLKLHPDNKSYKKLMVRIKDKE